MKIIRLEGTERDMGRAFGESCRSEIRAFYSLRVGNAIAQAKSYGGQDVTEEDLLAVARASEAATRAYDPKGWEELSGIAEGSGLSVTQVLAMNGLTDYRDVLSWPGNPSPEGLLPDYGDEGGCTAFAAQKDRGGVITGQTWDLATDNLPYVVGVVRKPKGGLATRTLTTVGCLSLIGMNEAGIAIGTTNVRTHDARPGVCYLSVIHKVLAQREFAAAEQAIVEAPRAGAHFYLLADASSVSMIECSAKEAHVERLESGVASHTNHCLLPVNQKIQASKPNSSSLFRLARMDALSEEGEISVARVQQMFADEAGGKDAICRDDFDGINTNGAVVMQPETGLVRMVHGLPSEGGWIDLTG